MEDLLKKIIGGVLKKVYPAASEAAAEGILQFVKFGLVGISNTAVSYLINIAVLAGLASFRVSWDFIAANTAAFLLSVLWSFYWNSRFVFSLEEGGKRPFLKTLLKTYAAYGFTGIVLNNLLSYVWIHMFGISKYAAPLINLVISVPVNYFINKRWTFRQS